jgi:hypothetical protein
MSDHQYSNSGVSTQSRDETLSNIWGGGGGGGDNSAGSSTIGQYGMDVSFTEGSLLPTRIEAASDLGGFSATTATGGPIADLASLQGSDLVTIGGETMSAEVALHLGLLVRDPRSGMIRSRDANEARANAAEQEQQNDEEVPPALDDHSEAILSEVVEGARGEALSAADNIMETGEISSHNVEQLASRLGIEPHEVQARAEHVRAAFHRQAVEVSSRSVGVSPAVAAAALEHARLHNHSALKQAAEQHINAGDVRYDSFVREYVQNLDSIAPDYILSALPGKARRDAGTGSIVVKTRHGEMLWGAGVRAGLIKI